jgi:hypothetical protein
MELALVGEFPDLGCVEVGDPVVGLEDVEDLLRITDPLGHREVEILRG